jgi:formylglycine-generating enzyme required for sulfatase activity
MPKRAASAAAVAAFDDIRKAVRFKEGVYFLYASSDQLVKDSSGALSIVCPGGAGEERWIVYDPDLIKGDLALHFALAHELAHHLNDNLQSGETPGKQQELDADRFAAQYLAGQPLNWSREKLVEALSGLPLPKEAKGRYPNLEERRTQVIEGYQESASLVQPVSSPAPAKTSAAPPDADRVAKAGSKHINPKDGLTYVWIPPGTFRMGCSQGDKGCWPDEEPHDVTITMAFWIGQTEVTQEAYQKVMGNNPSYFKGAKLPVENISWNDADAYCRAIGGRLPTEAEWEYAARAGSAASQNGGIDQVAWYDKNSVYKTHQVAQKTPNAWALHDMLGNVSEWAADWYVEKLPAAATDPKGPSSGAQRAHRGGSWSVSPGSARVSARGWSPPDLRNGGIGVRCVAEFP